MEMATLGGDCFEGNTLNTKSKFDIEKMKKKLTQEQINVCFLKGTES